VERELIINIAWGEGGCRKERRIDGKCEGNSSSPDIIVSDRRIGFLRMTMLIRVKAKKIKVLNRLIFVLLGAGCYILDAE